METGLNVDAKSSQIIANALDRLAKTSEENSQRLGRQEERMLKSEMTQTHLSESLDKLASTTEKMVETVERMAIDTTKFEQQLLALEERSIDRFDDTKDEIKTLKTDYANMQGRVYILELESAGNVGKKEAEANARKWWSDNWFKIVTLFVLLIPTIVAIYLSTQKVVGKG